MTDNITADSTVQLFGTTDVGTTAVYVYEGTTQIGIATLTGATTWSFTTTAMAAGSHTFSASSRDGTGTVTALSYPFIVTIDPAAPNTAPSAVASGFNIQQDQVVFIQAFAGISAVDPDSNPIVAYQLWDDNTNLGIADNTTSNTGYFLIDGVRQTAGHAIDEQLGDCRYQPE
jgi:hypothetical protein